MKTHKLTVPTLFASALLCVAGWAFAQGQPPKVRILALEKPGTPKVGHGVTVEGGKVHTSSVVLYIRDPNAPAKTSTITINKETREVTQHQGCPAGGCNLTGWKVTQAIKGSKR